MNYAVIIRHEPFDGQTTPPEVMHQVTVRSSDRSLCGTRVRTLVDMTREEAQKERERLSQEHPEATWLVREEDDGAWSVVKVGLPQPDKALVEEQEARSRRRPGSRSGLGGISQAAFDNKIDWCLGLGAGTANW